MNPIMLTMVRGDDLDLLVTFTDNNGVAVDDPTATYRMTAKSSEGDSDPGVFSVTAHQSTPGTATIHVPGSDTASLPSRILSLLYDIQVTETGGRVSTIQYGSLVVIPDVSRVTP